MILIKPNKSIFLISFISFNVICSTIPDDFSDFYTFKPTKITLKSVDGKSEKTEFFANYNTIKIDNVQTEKDIIKFFSEIKVKKEIQKKIIRELKSKKGIISTDKCHGAIDKCIVNSEEYDFLLDSDNNKVYFFINPKNLDKREKAIDYISNIDRSPSIINSSDLYLNMNNDVFSQTLNDKTTIGLKYGYLASDFSYNNSRASADDFDLRKLGYILDYKSYQLQVGAFDGTVEYNATGFLLSNNNNIGNISLNVSSSNNLLNDVTSSYQSLEFYSQSSGYLTLKREGNIIFQKNVPAGSGSISYNKLPSGVYDVELSIVSNGKKAFSQIFHIYNVQNGHLAKGKSDFMISTGMYNEKPNYIDIGDIDEDSLEAFYKSWFYRGMISYGLNDSFMIGGDLEVSSHDTDYLTKFGFNYLFLDNARISLILGNYKNGSSIKTMDISTPWFSLNYDDFKLDRNDVYAAYLEGNGSRKSINVNSNIMLSSILSSNISYTYNKYVTSSDRSSNSWNLTTTLDYRFGAGNIISGQIMYDKYDYDFSKQGEYSANINISIPIGNNLTYSMYAASEGHHFANFRNELSIDDLIDDKNKNMSLSVGHDLYGKEYHDSSKAYINVNGDYRSHMFRGNLYAFADTTGERNANIGLSNTQIISNKGVDFTENNATSYLKVDIDNDDDRIKNLGLLTLNSNNKLDSKRFVYDSVNLIPLNEYKKYTGALDTDSVSLENHGDTDISGFSFPGSVYHMKSSVSKVVSFITAFDDIFDQNISNVKCFGEGCIDVENIDGNIFSVKVRSGKEFVLKSNSLVCLTPGVRNMKNLNLGLNHCVPDIENMENGIAITKENGEHKKLFYLGIFDKSEHIKYKKELSKYNIIEKSINESENIVYVSFKDEYLLTNNDRIVFKNIMLTANNSNEINPYVLELDPTWFD